MGEGPTTRCTGVGLPQGECMKNENAFFRHSLALKNWTVLILAMLDLTLGAHRVIAAVPRVTALSGPHQSVVYSVVNSHAHSFILLY